MQLTQFTSAVPQLMNNIKEAKEVLAASLARGKADPVAESLEQKASEAKTEEQETKAEKPKPQVGRPRPLRNPRPNPSYTGPGSP